MAKDTDKRWKGLLQHWPTVADMDTEDYEYKALNQQQAAILLSAISAYRWQTRWIDLGITKDELELLISDIELRLMRNEDAGMVTKEELIEGICEGMQCYTENIAKRIISGVTGGIVIDEDGNVTVGGSADGGAELPDDDPATVLDETAAARSGGASAVRIGINFIWSSLNAWYVATVPLAEAQRRLKLIYKLNATETDTLVSQYYSDRQQAQPFVASFASTLDSYLYCKGLTQTVIAEWIFEVHTAAQQFQASLIVPALTQEQIDDWFTKGAETPSTDYLTYGCVPIDPETFTYTFAELAANLTKVGVGVHKLNHRILIEAEGKVFHPSDGSYQDFFYIVLANGAKSYMGAAGSAGTIQWNSPFSQPPQAKVPWRADGKYSVTMETTAAAVASFKRQIPLTHQNGSGTAFTIKFTDLGEVIN